MILVTGGTGFVGSHLLSKLVQKHDAITAIYRCKDKLKHTKTILSYYHNDSENLFKKIKWIEADILDVPALETAFKNISTVYHCAANLSFNPKDFKQARKDNVKGTANIVNLCLAFNVKKLCHVSSIATLGENQTLISEESTWNLEQNKDNIYAITKYDAELEVWRGTQENLNAVIVNPGLIIGPWHNGTGELFKSIKNGFNYFTNGSVGIVDVNDVVTSMINLTESSISNDRFILVSENISYKTLLTLIKDRYNNTKPLKEISTRQLTIFYYFNTIKRFLGLKHISLHKANIKSSFKNLNYSNKKFLDTNLNTFKPIEDTIKNTAKFI